VDTEYSTNLTKIKRNQRNLLILQALTKWGWPVLTARSDDL